MRRVKAGDLYVVPLDGDVSILCRVLFKSNYYKNVALIASYGKYKKDVPLNELSPIGCPLYTTVQAKKITSWEFIENIPVSKIEHLLSKRIVGGEVWVGDKHLGLPSNEEEKTLPQMDVYGERIFIKKIAKNT